MQRSRRPFDLASRAVDARGQLEHVTAVAGVESASVCCAREGSENERPRQAANAQTHRENVQRILRRDRSLHGPRVLVFTPHSPHTWQASSSSFRSYITSELSTTRIISSSWLSSCVPGGSSQARCSARSTRSTVLCVCTAVILRSHHAYTYLRGKLCASGRATVTPCR